jgi:hypothetical protein
VVGRPSFESGNFNVHCRQNARTDNTLPRGMLTVGDHATREGQLEGSEYRAIPTVDLSRTDRPSRTTIPINGNINRRDRTTIPISSIRNPSRATIRINSIMRSPGSHSASTVQSITHRWHSARQLILHFVPALFPLDAVDGALIRPAIPKEIADHKAYIDADQAFADEALRS